MIKLKAIWYFIIWGIPELCKFGWNATQAAWCAAKVTAMLHKDKG